jgi:hypothetical protein
MSFGLNNAASTFQRTMELGLQGLHWETCLVYIDDIVVFAADFNQHIERVTQVLERMKQAGLKLKPEKIQHAADGSRVSGPHRVEGGYQTRPHQYCKDFIVAYTKDSKTSQCIQFVPTGSYYRRFVKGFADMVRPMVDLTKKGNDFIWMLHVRILLKH